MLQNYDELKFIQILNYVTEIKYIQVHNIYVHIYIYAYNMCDSLYSILIWYEE